MERRRRNNIIIGTLCAVLVLMGVGYAILSTTLNIGGTANITGDFDIHFLDDDQNKKGISLIDYDNSTSGNTIYNTTVNNTIAAQMESGTEVDSQDSTNATFSAVLQKPTDYAIFTVTVKNYGSIDGYLTFSFEDTNDNFDYYDDFYSVEFIKEGTPDIKADILQNQSFSDSVVLSSGQSREYKIKVTFKESATSFPDPTHEINNEQVGAFECALNLTYSQQAPSNNQNSFVSNGWEVDSNGKVIAYNPNDIVNGVLTVPATTGVNGTGEAIRKIDGGSFINEWNIAVYFDLDNHMVGAVISDDDNYNKLSAFVQNNLHITNIGHSESDLNLSVDTYRALLNIDTTKENLTSSDLVFATIPTFDTLDLSNATNLKNIGSFAGWNVTGYQLFSRVILNEGLERIEASAFNSIPLSGTITIPSTLISIGIDAFYNTGITGLDFSNASSLTIIEAQAFNDDVSLSSIDLSGATSLTTIGDGAFAYGRFSSVIIPSNVTTIGDHAFERGSNISQYPLTITIKRADSTGMTLGSGWNGSATVVYDPN